MNSNKKALSFATKRTVERAPVVHYTWACHRRLGTIAASRSPPDCDWYEACKVSVIWIFSRDALADWRLMWAVGACYKDDPARFGGLGSLRWKGSRGKGRVDGFGKWYCIMPQKVPFHKVCYLSSLIFSTDFLIMDHFWREKHLILMVSVTKMSTSQIIIVQ